MGTRYRIFDCQDILQTASIASPNQHSPNLLHENCGIQANTKEIIRTTCFNKGPSTRRKSFRKNCQYFKISDVQNAVEAHNGGMKAIKALPNIPSTSINM